MNPFAPLGLSESSLEDELEIAEKEAKISRLHSSSTLNATDDPSSLTRKRIAVTQLQKEIHTTRKQFKAQHPSGNTTTPQQQSERDILFQTLNTLLQDRNTRHQKQDNLSRALSRRLGVDLDEETDIPNNNNHTNNNNNNQNHNYNLNQQEASFDDDDDDDDDLEQ